MCEKIFLILMAKISFYWINTVRIFHNIVMAVSFLYFQRDIKG